jgi:tetratricopeptide (TPR) repeat protein
MKLGAALVLAGAIVLAEASPAAAQARIDPNAPAEALEAIKMLTKDPEIIAGFEDLMTGVGHIQKADFPAAEKVFKRSIAVLEKHFPDTPYPGMVNGLLATVYIGMGDPARAEPRVELFLRAARMEKIVVRLNGMVVEMKLEEELRSFNLGMALSLKGMMLERRGDYAGAEAVYRESLALWRKLFPKDKFPDGHFMIIGTLANLAKVAALRGDYDAAERHADEAVAALKPFFEMKPVLGLDVTVAAAALANLAAGE